MSSSWVMMKRCLFWTNEAFWCSAISKIYCDWKCHTIYLHYLCKCTTRFQSEVWAKGQTRHQNAAEIIFVSMNIRTQLFLQITCKCDRRQTLKRQISHNSHCLITLNTRQLMLPEAATWHTMGHGPYACGLQHTHLCQYKYEKKSSYQSVLSDGCHLFERLYV